ncbi:MAG TPA: HAD-IIB family hydrolase [Burkholderiales bacterium]|nr:HAD-IIB family hydrolase [Burkholderiales bacterium]
MLDARLVEFVLLDIDDTLTTRGKLGADAYAALEALQRGGRKTIAVTGRPAGWCDHIARMWPVDAVVGENGAFYFWFAQGKLGKRFIDEASARAEKRRRLQEISERILQEVPGARISSDQAYRETDLAIDFCEDVDPPLTLEAAEAIARRMREAGLTAKISSIHVNGWFGDYDKLATTRKLFSERFQLDLDAVNAQVVFAGDSPNDAPMFSFFRHSVGVANVRRFPGLQPRFITRAEAGAGFAELARHLLRTP